MFSVCGCYSKAKSVNLAFSPVADSGFGFERRPLQHGGFGCLGRLETQVMKCLFMVIMESDHDADD